MAAYKTAAYLVQRISVVFVRLHDPGAAALTFGPITSPSERSAT